MLFYAVALFSFLSLSFSKNNCELCRKVMEVYRLTFYEVDPNISLGGGNSDWEEKFIGKYAFSELHAFEILERTLKKLNDHEAHFLSEIEVEIEKFWFDMLRSGHANWDDIVNFICIEMLRQCCPWNKFGADCSDCYPCNPDNGFCDGNGTRTGTGLCSCRQGYFGKSCEICDHLTHFQSSLNGSVYCVPCHPSCFGGCADGTSFSCVSCAKGYTLVIDGDMRKCEDIDECANGSSVCKQGTYCANKEGSFTCLRCPEECTSCNDPSLCLSCSPGFILKDTKCVDINECASSDRCSGAHQRCINKPGSYHCVCEDGYRFKQGECVAHYPQRSLHRSSRFKWSSRQTNKILVEFAKLILILVCFGLILYFVSGRFFFCSSLAALTVVLICYQAYILDNVL